MHSRAHVAPATRSVWALQAPRQPRCSKVVARASSDPKLDGLSEAQKAFLERRRQHRESGWKVLPMPPEAMCPRCEGEGNLKCPACKGTGVNAEGASAEQLGDDVYLRAPTSSSGMFMTGMPCWMCKGRRELPCGPCMGQGVRDAFDKYTTED